MFSNALLDRARSFTSSEPVQSPSEDHLLDGNLNTTWNGLLFWLVAALAAMVGYGWALQGRSPIEVISAGLLISAAAASPGILLGFLFGIPRSLQEGNAKPGDTQNGEASSLRVNTNLEQISDWLTKILVGVGLTQIGQFGPRIWKVAEAIAPALGGSTSIALAVLINFVIWGFFVGYLLTRLFLASAFSYADNKAGRLRTQERQAYQFTQRGAYTTAATQYAKAMAQITPGTSPTQKQRIIEGLIYNSLYMPAPDGFMQAQTVAQEYLSDSANAPSGRILAWLAAAYGQEFSYRLAEGQTADASPLRELREKTLVAVREALRLEPGLKSVLRSLWDPNDGAKQSDDENDLEAFASDPAFAALLK